MEISDRIADIRRQLISVANDVHGVAEDAEEAIHAAVKNLRDAGHSLALIAA